MIVYLLSLKQDTIKVNLWKNRVGIYGGEKIGFSLMIDRNGNICCAKNYDTMQFLPFYNEIITSELIVFEEPDI